MSSIDDGRNLRSEPCGEVSSSSSSLWTITSSAAQTVWTSTKRRIRQIVQAHKPPEDGDIELSPLLASYTTSEDPSISSPDENQRSKQRESQPMNLITSVGSLESHQGGAHSAGARSQDNQRSFVDDDQLREVFTALAEYRMARELLVPLSTEQTIGSTAIIEENYLVTGSTTRRGVVAVKKFRFGEKEDDRKRTQLVFRNELRTLSTLNHDNLLRLVGFVEDTNQDIAWLVVPWSKNGNVRDFVRATAGDLPERHCEVHARETFPGTRK